jgi:hypothetical protein
MSEREKVMRKRRRKKIFLIVRTVVIIAVVLMGLLSFRFDFKAGKGKTMRAIFTGKCLMLKTDNEYEIKAVESVNPNYPLRIMIKSESEVGLVNTYSSLEELFNDWRFNNGVVV